MKIYPILNNLGKGKYVFIFILNERAVILLQNDMIRISEWVCYIALSESK